MEPSLMKTHRLKSECYKAEHRAVSVLSTRWWFYKLAKECLKIKTIWKYISCPSNMGTSMPLCSNISFLCWVTSWHLYLTFSSVKSVSILTNSSSTGKSLIYFSRGPDKPQKSYPTCNFIGPKETGWECHMEHRWMKTWTGSQAVINLQCTEPLLQHWQDFFLVSKCVRSVL